MGHSLVAHAIVHPSSSFILHSLYLTGSMHRFFGFGQKLSDSVFVKTVFFLPFLNFLELDFFDLDFLELDFLELDFFDLDFLELDFELDFLEL
eukprot:CAMPEP_0116844928 /NCGR_PEP_ID=MMETSP0418-20121206/12977_1 /TAXON_ID=1158023 /ORGANISM="Astrosyne radiata, Strain 13vi08-1A" /LENGTH=92 /DNA_ID=CAMNT_0004475969 /DNA_START=217 /DNA_END=491 /DNA_ORIENTATION=-